MRMLDTCSPALVVVKLTMKMLNTSKRIQQDRLRHQTRLKQMLGPHERVSLTVMARFQPATLKRRSLLASSLLILPTEDDMTVASVFLMVLATIEDWQHNE